MKRPWAYVASFVPFTTASSTSEGSIVTPDELSRMRSKNDLTEDDGRNSSGNQGGQDGDGRSPNAKTPSNGSADEASQDSPHGQAYSGGGSGQPLPNLDASMYQPSGGHGPAVESAAAGPYYSGGGGGGGGISVTQTLVQQGAPLPGTTPDPGAPGEDETGYVEPDQADADAMMLLLGGMATGSGEGAMASGEIVFDIVDYGLFTIGYGYSIFQAQGEDGAVAISYADVTGADVVFSFDDFSFSGNAAFSSTFVLALDFEDDSMMLDDPGLGEVNWYQLLSQGPFAQWVLDGEQELTIDGNTSSLSFSMDAPLFEGGEPMFNAVTMAVDEIGSSVNLWLQSQHASLSIIGEAESVDSLASADGSLLEIDDHYSSVSATAIGIA